MKRSVNKLVVWRKNGTRTKKHLWELQRSCVDEYWEWAECQGVVTKDGGRAKLQRRCVKRRKLGKK